jgi:hypothetical protein
MDANEREKERDGDLLTTNHAKNTKGGPGGFLTEANKGNKAFGIAGHGKAAKNWRDWN